MQNVLKERLLSFKNKKLLSLKSHEIFLKLDYVVCVCVHLCVYHVFMCVCSVCISLSVYPVFMYVCTQSHSIFMGVWVHVHRGQRSTLAFVPCLCHSLAFWVFQVAWASLIQNDCLAKGQGEDFYPATPSLDRYYWKNCAQVRDYSIVVTLGIF